MRNSLWCYYSQLIVSIALEKCKKECDIVKNIMLQGEGFCPLKIEINQFPDGFRLRHFLCDHLLGYGFNMILAIVKDTIYVATKL